MKLENVWPAGSIAPRSVNVDKDNNFKLWDAVFNCKTIKSWSLPFVNFTDVHCFGLSVTPLQTFWRYGGSACELGCLLGCVTWPLTDIATWDDPRITYECYTCKSINGGSVQIVCLSFCNQFQTPCRKIWHLSRCEKIVPADNHQFSPNYQIRWWIAQYVKLSECKN